MWRTVENELKNGNTINDTNLHFGHVKRIIFYCNVKNWATVANETHNDGY